MTIDLVPNSININSDNNKYNLMNLYYIKEQLKLYCTIHFTYIVDIKSLLLYMVW